jgi:hypothetical protein
VIPRLGRERLPRGVRIVAVRPALRRQVYALWRTANTRRRAVGVTVAAFRTSASRIANPELPVATTRDRKRLRR